MVHYMNYMNYMNSYDQNDHLCGQFICNRIYQQQRNSIQYLLNKRNDEI